jgi:hypothetical protein
MSGFLVWVGLDQGVAVCEAVLLQKTVHLSPVPAREVSFTDAPVCIFWHKYRMTIVVNHSLGPELHQGLKLAMSKKETSSSPAGQDARVVCLDRFRKDRFRKKKAPVVDNQPLECVPESLLDDVIHHQFCAGSVPGNEAPLEREGGEELIFRALDLWSEAGE